MSQPFMGEIRMVGFTFAPVGWAFCDGALIAISQNDALYVLLGTTYGGDGLNTFALPDLRGRLPMHQGQSNGTSPHVIGQVGGSEDVTLTTQQIPSHSHAFMAGVGGTRTASPNGNLLGSGEADIYNHDTGSPVTLAGGTLANAGASLPHSNVQPFLCVNFIIALYGIFPSQS